MISSSRGVIEFGFCPPRDCEGEAPRDCEGEAPRDCGGDCGEGASRDGGGEGSDCGPSPSARHVPSCPPRNCDWSGPLPLPSPGTSRRGGEQERSPELWWADLDSGFPPPTTAGRGGTLDHEIAAAPYKLKKTEISCTIFSFSEILRNQTHNELEHLEIMPLFGLSN